MPNRGIKESILTSQTIDRLSPLAERFFYRLLLVCDDYGRTDADERVLRSRCFPLQIDRVSNDDVAGWLNELESAGLIVTYRSGDRRYLQFVNWDKHQRRGRHAKHSKFPAPPADVFVPIAGQARTSPGNGAGSAEPACASADVQAGSADPVASSGDFRGDPPVTSETSETSETKYTPPETPPVGSSKPDHHERAWLLQHIRDAVSRVPPDRAESAPSFRRALMDELRKAGFTVPAVFPAASLFGTGHVDILARIGPDVVGIEVDRARPSQKSAEKLRGTPGLALRAIVLREPSGDADGELPDGIDSVVAYRPTNAGDPPSIDVSGIRAAVRHPGAKELVRLYFARNPPSGYRTSKQVASLVTRCAACFDEAMDVFGFDELKQAIEDAKPRQWWWEIVDGLKSRRNAPPARAAPPDAPVRLLRPSGGR